MKKPYFRKIAIALSLSLAMALPTLSHAETYAIDDYTKGSHAFIQFRVKHLGMSWLYGRFDEFSGQFEFDADSPDKNSISLSINTASVTTNHADRDKHIRSGDFLDVEKFPTATFESTSFTPSAGGGTLTGNLTLHGVTKEISFDINHIGGGDDPWGGHRQGFDGYITIQPNDYGIDMVGQLGPAAAEVEMMLSIEGVRL